MKNNINQSTCKNCGICREVCPIKVIGQNGSVQFIKDREHLCLQCGQCMAVCPTKSIQVDGLSYDDFYKLPSIKNGYKNFMDVVSTRRSVRNFKSQVVSEELVDEIINSISYAPYGAAPEKMEINIINNREKIESVLPLISDFFQGLEKMVENPVSSQILRIIAGKEDFHTVKNHIYPIAKSGNYNLGNGDGITRGAPCLITIHASKDAEAHSNNGVIYATYMMLAAHALGLGATMIECIIPAINRNKKLKQLFQIPKDNEAIMSLVIGHPKYPYKRTIKRQKHKVHKVE